MRRRPSSLATAIAAVVSVVLVVAGCEARVYGTPPDDTDAPQLTVVAPPQGGRAALPEAPPGQPAATFDGLDARARQATADAAKSGADISVVALDRNTGQIVSNGHNQAFPIASVVKLFIADDLLLQESNGQTRLSPADRQSLDVMLRSSDDNAAQNFWNRGGGNAVITRVDGAVRVDGHEGALQLPLGRHAEHRKRSGPLLRHAAGRKRRAAARTGQRHHGQSRAVNADRYRWLPATLRNSRGPLCRAGCRQTGLVLLLERRQPVARVHRRNRTRAPLRDGDQLAGTRRLRRDARHHHPGGQDDVPRREI